MNPMYDFTDKEIALIDMAVIAIAQVTNEATNQGITPPDGLVEAIQSTINKIQQVLELRNQNNEQFEALAESLNDVANVGNLIANSHPIPETHEYN
jgi:hypothetical protein